jgi:TolB-like protein
LDFRFDDFEIDLGQQELRRGGQTVRIEPQVFELLVFLVRNANRMVTKEELIEAVWQGRVISEAALSSCVSAARRAIGDTGKEQRRIRTASKRGFRFVGPLDEAAPPQTLVSDNAAFALESSHAATPVELTPPPGTLALPDKPSIAVLPFQNMSGDPEQEYFADGLTEDIITGLSRQQWFFVIARNSSFTYKGEAVDVRKVASQLGVRYVLEGSVRKVADRVRVTGQLIDAAHGIHLWADKYDRELENIFELQDEITNRVIGSVGPQILAAEAARIRRKPPQSFDAWDLVMQALPHMWRVSAEDQRRAQKFLQQAISLDDEYAHAHALLGWTYVSLFNLDARAPISDFTDKRWIRARRRWRSITKSPGAISCSASGTRGDAVPNWR